MYIKFIESSQQPRTKCGKFGAGKLNNVLKVTEQEFEYKSLGL